MANASYTDHDAIADGYTGAASSYATAWTASTLPHARLENELVGRMLGPVPNQRILDIAGGSGAHARRALAQGASHIDVVDLSPGMLEVGRAQPLPANPTGGPPGTVSWHVGDAYKPFESQLPSLPVGGYDTIMVIWGFDHAANVRELETIWENIGKYLTEGGRVVAIRMADPWAKAGLTGKYGSRYHDVERVEGGVKLRYSIMTGEGDGEGVFTLAASSMEASYGGSTKLAERNGVRDVEVVDLRECEVVREDLEFWDLMLTDPHWVGFTGVKRAA